MGLFSTLWTIAYLLCPWNSPGKTTEVGCHSLLQGIFLTQGSNPGLPHCRQILDHLRHQRSPVLSKDPLKITLSISQFGPLELKILFSHCHNGLGLLRWNFCEGNGPTSSCGSQPKSQVHSVELSPWSGQTSYSFDSSIHCQEHSHIQCLPPEMPFPLLPSVSGNWGICPLSLRSVSGPFVVWDHSTKPSFSYIFIGTNMSLVY